MQFWAFLIFLLTSMANYNLCSKSFQLLFFALWQFALILLHSIQVNGTGNSNWPICFGQIKVCPKRIQSIFLLKKMYTTPFTQFKLPHWYSSHGNYQSTFSLSFRDVGQPERGQEIPVSRKSLYPKSGQPVLTCSQSGQDPDHVKTIFFLPWQVQS